jgi:hypothetical protein
MPTGGAGRYSGEFAMHERQGRIEPELGPPTVSRTAYPSIASDSSAAAAGPSDRVSKVQTEPRLFEPVPRETRPTSTCGRSHPTERSRVSSVFHLLPVGLIGAAIVGVFFGIAFSLLPQSKDKTASAGGSAFPAAEQFRSTPKGSASSGNPPATIVASAENASTSDQRPADPSAPPPQVNSSPANAEAAGPPRKPTPSAGAIAANRGRAHLATRRSRSAHYHPRPPVNAEKPRILSAAMDRAHRKNFSDPFQSLTPPQAGGWNSFDQLIAQLTEQAKPVRSLTPP